MQTELQQLIGRLASRDAPRTEAVVQADVRQLLLTAELSLSERDLKDVLLESQVGDRRRIDVEAGSTVIEVKKDLRLGNVRDDAVGQLRGYVEARQNTHGGRWVGVLTDGAEWRCYHLRDERMEEVSTLTVSGSRPDVDALLIWIEGVLATARDLRPTPDQIQMRLGVGSSAHALDRAGLGALFDANRNAPVVKTKRRLWARLLETALGTQFDDSDELFVEHTLLVNTAEIIAHAVLGIQPASVTPQSLLSGAKFDEAGVFGVVEADFFDWVVDVPKGEVFVRALARRIARFDWGAVDHDVLKVLYESVIGAETRKKLGEYYTPDWLAEKIVETAYLDPLESRVLDPACGSGTFLFHAVHRYLDAATKAGMSTTEMLDGVTSHVLGMDLHPVAVTLARVTYLLALGRERLVNPRRGPIRVPVFLGDSIQWRQKNPGLFSNDELTIPVDDQKELASIPGLKFQREIADVTEFKFPKALLKDARLFDNVVAELADLASQRRQAAKVPSLVGFFQRLAIPDELQATISASFRTMCRLHDEGRDHIWGYYIRNLARPDWMARPENRVDLLIGNPPWLSYRFMSESMQEDFREMSAARGLWHGAKLATHQDLSALFATRAIQLYLKPKGRFALVMPSAVLDRGQYRGFRTGTYDGRAAMLSAQFSIPWDLRKLRPHFFPITASVVFGRRSSKASPLPRDAEVWSGRLPNGGTTWSSVANAIDRRAPRAGQDRHAVTPRSPYHPRFRQGATIVPRVLFMVERQPVGPLGQVANKAPVRSARSANEKKPWRDLEALEGVVETEFVYRVHLGETVLPYRVLEPRDAILPIDKKGILDGQDDRLQVYTGLASWWAKAEACWEKGRSSERLSLKERLDYHGELSGQFPIQAQRVVYAKSGMHIAAARLLDHRAVIDHKLYWASARSADEAHYLCAILNAAVVTRMVRPLMSYGKDERDIDKYVWALPIPMFDPNNRAHVELAMLGKRAEDEIKQLPLVGGKHFAASRRTIRDWLEKSRVGVAIEVAVTGLLK